MAKYLFRLICLLVLAIPAVSWLTWHAKPKQSIKLLVLDKTTPDDRYAEHISLNWVLNYNKWTKSSGALYLDSKDYYGFFPLVDGNYIIRDLEDFSPEQIEATADSLDVIFYADTYGIYSSNWTQHEFYGTDTVIKVYGGLQEKDYQLLREMKKKGKSLVGEFNLFASPTSASIRKRTEELFDVYTSGWTGRYFHSLDTVRNPELPSWVTSTYRKQYQKSWSYTKSGIVLVNGERIIVLEKDTHLSHEVPYIVTNVIGQVQYELPEKVHYPYWFEIDSLGSQNNVLASFHIGVNDRGDSLLHAENIPHSFPALIESDQDYYLLYMTGDFSDNPISGWSSCFEGIPKISSVFYNSSQLDDRTAFFWQFYYPLISNVLSHADKRGKAKEREK